MYWVSIRLLIETFPFLSVCLPIHKVGNPILGSPFKAFCTSFTHLTPLSVKKKSVLLHWLKYKTSTCDNNLGIAQHIMNYLCKLCIFSLQGDEFLQWSELSILQQDLHSPQPPPQAPQLSPGQQNLYGEPCWVACGVTKLCIEKDRSKWRRSAIEISGGWRYSEGNIGGIPLKH